MASRIVTNLLSIHVPVGAGTIVFACHGGSYNAPVATITLDGTAVIKTAQIVDFVRTRSFVTAVVNGADPSSEIGGITKCGGVDLLTAEEPVQ